MLRCALEHWIRNVHMYIIGTYSEEIYLNYVGPIFNLNEMDIGIVAAYMYI